MEEKAIEKTLQNQTWKIKIWVIGGVIGALVGVVSAFLITRNAEKTGKAVAISSKEGLQLGMWILGLIRSIATLQKD